MVSELSFLGCGFELRFLVVSDFCGVWCWLHCEVCWWLVVLDGGCAVTGGSWIWFGLFTCWFEFRGLGLGLLYLFVFVGLVVFCGFVSL